jgi:hypothetical protein
VIKHGTHYGLGKILALLKPLKIFSEKNLKIVCGDIGLTVGENILRNV